MQVRIVNVQVQYLTSTEAKFREEIKHANDEKAKLTALMQVCYTHHHLKGVIGRCTSSGGM